MIVARTAMLPLSLLAVAGLSSCNRGSSEDSDAPVAIQPGTVSDAMPAFDRVRSEAPLANPEAQPPRGGQRREDDMRGEAAPVRERVAAPPGPPGDPETAAPNPASSPTAAAEEG